MRILICDDDPGFSGELHNRLCEYFHLHALALPEIAIYEDGDSLLADTGDKDLVFLDVEMPGLSGIQIGNRLAEQNPATLVIMITSYPQYLDDAMRFHVFRYLSKPLDVARLFRNLKDALYIHATTTSKIVIETPEKTITVQASDIICVNVLGRKVSVLTTKGLYNSTRDMLYWHDTLTLPCFFQTHRSFIVNMAYVAEFDHDTIHLAHTSQTAYLTRRRYREFKESYLLYLESVR